MGDAGDEESSGLISFDSRLFGVGERCGHALDCLGDVRDLADPAAGHGDRQVSAGDLVDLRAEAGEWVDHPAAGEPNRDRQAGEQDDEPADERDDRASGVGRGTVVEVGDQRRRRSSPDARDQPTIVRPGGPRLAQRGRSERSGAAPVACGLQRRADVEPRLSLWCRGAGAQGCEEVQPREEAREGGKRGFEIVAMGGEVADGGVQSLLNGVVLVVAFNQPASAAGQRRRHQQDEDAAEDEAADADRRSHVRPASSR